MPDQPHPRLPGFWSQALAILKLATQSARNKFGKAKAPEKGMRSATAYKHDRLPALQILMMVLFLGIAGNSAYQGIHGLARHAQNLWPSGAKSETIRVSFLEHFHLSNRADQPEASSEDSVHRETNSRQLTDTILDETGGDEATARARADRLVAQLEEVGMEGFARESGGSEIYTFVDIRKLSPNAKEWLGRVLAFVIGCFVVALILTPLSARSKDLGALDAQLEWFYCLPLTGREILSGRFTAAALVKPLAWIVLPPLCSVLFWAMGYGITSVLYAFIVTLALSIATAGFELAIETLMRTSASFRLKKNVQSIATVLGTLTMILAFAAGIAGGRSVGWIDWLLEHTPVWLTAVPGKIVLLPASGYPGLLTFLGLISIGSLACGYTGWLLAARAMRRGLTSGNERLGTRSSRATEVAKTSSLARFEWLLLLRDRNLATTVLVVPLIMVFYQLLINPEMLAEVSGQKLAVLGFGCGVWAATTTAPHVLLSESNSLWMIFSLPVSISDHFQRRTRAWRLSGTVMAGLVIAGLGLWKGFPADDWWRVPAALVGVWVISLVVYAIMMGDAKLPDTARGERPKIGVIRIYACMLIGGAVGSVIWFGTGWQILTTLVLWWFFGFGIWQGVTRKLQYLLEPTDHAEPQLTLASAIFAIIVFFAAQAIVGTVLIATIPDHIPTAILFSYIAGGVAALLFCGLRMLNHKLPNLAASETKRHLLLPACLVVCIAAAAVWLALLENFPPLQALQDSAKASALIKLDPKEWQIVLLAVLAAPILEEIVFRGFVLRIMQSVWTPKYAILANALLFAIIHPPLSFPPVFLLGAAAAFLYTRTQKLWPSIVLHAAYNAAVVAMQ